MQTVSGKESWPLKKLLPWHEKMKKQKRAVLLINMGSPESPRIRDVRSYLKEFLSDPDVIDLPSWIRFLLVYGFIAPIRSFRSARLYEQLNTERGFPLIFHSMDLENKLKEKFKNQFDVYFGMRYGEPSLSTQLSKIRKLGYDELIVLPLYPQYASSTTGSVTRLLHNELSEDVLCKRTHIFPQFHPRKDFIELWQKKIINFNPSDYDAVLFSYHGIPLRQAESTHPGISCKRLHCTEEYTASNEYCYHAACFHTTRSIVKDLDIDDSKIFTAFQSRFGKNWLSPFTDQTLITLAKNKKKNVLIISPSFVADCLETTVEIEIEYKILFKKAGGEKLVLVPSLNSDSDWISVIANLITSSNRNTIVLEDAVNIQGKTRDTY